jgi:integrase
VNTFGRARDIGKFTNQTFKEVLKKAGIYEKFTFHDLRHTHVTLLLLKNVNPKVIQERLGHSTIKMTLDTYSHLLPDMQNTAVAALDELLPLKNKNDFKFDEENI